MPHATARGEVDDPPRPVIEECDASACAIGGRDGVIGIEMRNRTMNLGDATTIRHHPMSICYGLRLVH